MPVRGLFYPFSWTGRLNLSTPKAIFLDYRTYLLIDLKTRSTGQG